MTRIPVLAIAAATAAAMALPGCGLFGGSREQPPQQPKQTSYRRPWSDDDVVKPDWIANPTRSGSVVAAWGSAPHDAQAGRGAMRDKALASARRELANMIKVRVQSVMKDYLAESGGTSGAAVTSYSESVGRTIADESLAASAQQDEWIHPKTGELFVWAVVDRRFAERMASEVAQSAASDPAANAHVRAKLESDKGFAELDRLLDKSFKGP